jgi:peptidyl-prolyl cis-trans isomerase SurA
MTVANEKVSKSDFLSIYNKNNVKGEVIDKKSLEEYLELFINFKLKVKEAEELGMDTLTTFKTELAGYRKQLAQNYLVDNDMTDKLIEEAYQRMQKDVRASHILIKLEPGASPKDTLEAFTKALNIRKRIMAGDSFEKLAKEFSDDLSAKDKEASGNRPAMKGNGGDLGYFTVFDMVYPFETAAFSTKPGEVSKPIRTDYGYHLIKVTDLKKAMGRARAAHIFVAFPTTSNPEDSLNASKKIYEAYEKLNAGTEYDTLVNQYSDDKATAAKGGVLPWFGVNRMVPEFIVAVSKMAKIGEYSQPITTSFGWHIVKLLDKKEIGTLDELKGEIKQKVNRDTRSQLSKEAVIAKIKSEYGYTEFIKAKEAMIAVMDTTLFSATWDAAKADKKKDVLFTLDTKPYTQTDFAKYLAKDQKTQNHEDLTSYLNAKYKKYTDESLMEYKDSKLESEFPDFKSLMKEYRDGILLFDLTDKKVWSKAVKDTLGLESYYQLNKANYVWGERVHATIFKSKDKDVLEKAWKMADKAWKSGKYDEEKINKKFNKTEDLVLPSDKGKYSKGDSKLIDQVAFEPGVYKIPDTEGYAMFVVVNQKLTGEIKTLSEARGLVTADYQNFLEKEWIKTLRAKYPIQVNKDVLSTIK